MAEPRIRLAVDGSIATITLARADKLNALDLDMLAELSAILDRVEADSAVRVVILTGEGKAFSAGGDIAGQRSRRRSGSCGAGCGGRRGSSGRSCTAAGGQGSSSGSSAADGQERTTSDLFHNNISFNWAGPFVLAGLFSFSSLYLSWDAFIVAHRPSSCDHGGAKCR